MPKTPAAWYSDPIKGPAHLRYWDGTQWTSYLFETDSLALEAKPGNPPQKTLLGRGSLACALAGASINILTVIYVLQNIWGLWFSIHLPPYTPLLLILFLFASIAAVALGALSLTQKPGFAGIMGFTVGILNLSGSPTVVYLLLVASFMLST
ncbi:MAG: DUF2510 domain-containing protein [Coriobacteriia bacterium]|nr:DUF2510 domain-containing protein [Coriobacteriia bacterium]